MTDYKNVLCDVDEKIVGCLDKPCIAVLRKKEDTSLCGPPVKWWTGFAHVLFLTNWYVCPQGACWEAW
jgi:hypothetical protein